MSTSGGGGSTSTPVSLIQIYWPAAAGGQPCILAGDTTHLRYTDAGIPAYWHGSNVTQVYFQGSRVNEWYRNGQQIYRRAKNYYRLVRQYRIVRTYNEGFGSFLGTDGRYYYYTGTTQYVYETLNEYHSESWA